MDLLDKLKEGFIALSKDGMKLLFANAYAKRVLTQLCFTQNHAEAKQFEVNDLDLEIFAKVPPQILKEPENGTP